jgi:hypothetical protein
LHTPFVRSILDLTLCLIFRIALDASDRFEQQDLAIKVAQEE